MFKGRHFGRSVSLLGSVALTCQATGYGSCSDRQTHYRLCLAKLMQQMGLSNRSLLSKPFIEIARRYHRRSVDGSRTEGTAIALLVLLGPVMVACREHGCLRGRHQFAA